MYIFIYMIDLYYVHCSKKKKFSVDVLIKVQIYCTYHIIKAVCFKYSQ